MKFSMLALSSLFALLAITAQANAESSSLDKVCAAGIQDPRCREELKKQSAAVLTESQSSIATKCAGGHHDNRCLSDE